jgi:hypothetical protein
MFFVSFDLQPRARLPQCFAREYYDTLEPYVILEDPNKNMIEVRVSKKSNKLYFDEGWSILKRVYDILLGAWVSFAYVNPKLLLIRLMTRWGTEVEYPSFNPPLKYLVNKKASYVRLYKSLSSNVSQKSYVHSYVKKITHYDIHSGNLVIYT